MGCARGAKRNPSEHGGGLDMGPGGVSCRGSRVCGPASRYTRLGLLSAMMHPALVALEDRPEGRVRNMAVTVKRITLWRTEVENQPGMLARTLKPLADAGASLQVVMAYRLPGNPTRAAFE